MDSRERLASYPSCQVIKKLGTSTSEKKWQVGKTSKLNSQPYSSNSISNGPAGKDPIKLLMRLTHSSAAACVGKWSLLANVTCGRAIDRSGRSNHIPGGFSQRKTIKTCIYSMTVRLLGIILTPLYFVIRLFMWSGKIQYKQQKREHTCTYIVYTYKV